MLLPSSLHLLSCSRQIVLTGNRPVHLFCLRHIVSTGNRSLHLSCLRLGHSYYDDLGVHPQASSKEVKEAFYRLSKEFHPDRNVDNESALKKFQKISEAYDILSTPAKRTKYDKGVLGRSSSVAEREAATHKFEGETFYGARGGRAQRGGEPTKNLDSWVKDARSINFATKMSKKNKPVDGVQPRDPLARLSAHDKIRIMRDPSNPKTDLGLARLLIVIFILVVVIRIVV